MRITPHHTHNFRYVVDDVFGRAASPGYWGLMAAAAEHAYCNTTADSAVALPEGKAMTSHVKFVNPWETGSATRTSTGVRVNAPQRGEANEPLSTSVCVDYFVMVSVKRSASDQTALIASSSRASDNVILFGSWER